MDEKTVKKGQIVRVDKDKYLNSINVRLKYFLVLKLLLCNLFLKLCFLRLLRSQYLSVGHPPFYKGLDYIYEDRGEVYTEINLI